ncbi:hypothetical protein HYT17_00725 [Candidatus Microgenomates bacterium]|nr:hypothetical protein [Candidatus Microgenomates bacterium]
MINGRYILGFLSGALLGVLFFVLLPQVQTKWQNFSAKREQEKLLLQKEKLIEQVMPKNGVRLGIRFNDAVVKMVEEGVIDKDKMLSLGNGYEKFLNQPSGEELVINKENATVLLNLLWPLGLTNKTTVLTEGPMGTTYKNDVGNFASTGGWTIGKEEGGKLFNRFTIISLTPEQEAVVKEMAENIYRSCCGNSTFFPDCNHGAAMLGFLELAVSAGMSKEEIYKKALYLNSFWFPQTYLDLANYFQVKEKKQWKDLDPKMLLGQKYSSGQGYGAVRKEMQEMGILEKSQSGASCGV